MSEVRYNNAFGSLGADPGTGSVITFSEVPEFATVNPGDFVKICLDQGTGRFEIVYLTAFTAGTTTGTIQRAAEDGANWPAVSHPAGVWTCAPTADDFTDTVGSVTQVTSNDGDLIVSDPTTTPDLALAPSGVTADTYGSSTEVPVVSVSATGIVTGVTTAAISVGGSGTVTTASVVSANGLAGTVANATTTPAITLSTSITGVLKGNGTAISAATGGTDYVVPGGALGTPSSGTLTNATGLPESGVTNLTTDLAAKALGLTPVVLKTGAYAANANEFVPCDVTSAGFTVTLPTTPADKTRVGIKLIRGQSPTNFVTYTCGGSDTLNAIAANGGVATGNLLIKSQSETMQYQASTGVWYLQAGDTPLGQLDTRYVGSSLYAAAYFD